jgi:hypothetical protein
VLEVVKGMNNDKVPSLDGFTMTFFQSCWDVIKDVMRVFHDLLLLLLSFRRNLRLLMLMILVLLV